jgi:hypothetical protein
MRVALLVGALFATAACGDKPGKSICDNTVPPPAVCQTQCDPNPAAPNTCPSGYHCAPDGFCDALCTPAGGECGDGYTCTSDGRCQGEGECNGLECNVVDCAGMGMTDTTIKGTVYAPNGTLPLYGITVYVPNAPVGALTEGAECSRCSDDLPGSPLVRTTTDENGNFTLTGAPAGADIPLVITSGKWRRQITIPSVGQCAETALPGADTRLPKNKSEGDIPKIALTTGDADSLECLIRKLGIDDAEITSSSGMGRVNFFEGDGVDGFAAGFAGGANQSFSPATGFWDDVNKLKPYDIVILSCEGGQQDTPKDQGDLDAMKAYADLGGRVFASHWHNIWIGGGFQAGGNPVINSWEQVATWENVGNLADGSIDLIDENQNPKGASFATWMFSPGVMGSTVRGEIVVNDGRITAKAVDPARGERWTFVKGGQNQVQNFQFTTPQEQPVDQRCGKVVFSDMHVSGGPDLSNGKKYPNSCGNNGMLSPLTPQEKALAFMLFDLASCVGVIL